MKDLQHELDSTTEEKARLESECRSKDILILELRKNMEAMAEELEVKDSQIEDLKAKVRILEETQACIKKRPEVHEAEAENSPKRSRTAGSE